MPAGQTLFDTATGVDLPPQRRRLGYVFQDYALFPHLSVRQNVAFGLQKGWLNPRIGQRFDAVEQWLHAFRIDAVGDLLPSQISGGQRQRTRWRALVTQPQRCCWMNRFPRWTMIFAIICARSWRPCWTGPAFRCC